MKLFGRSSAAELVDFIEEVKVRQTESNAWVVHLKHQGE